MLPFTGGLTVRLGISTLALTLYIYIYIYIYQVNTIVFYGMNVKDETKKLFMEENKLH